MSHMERLTALPTTPDGLPMGKNGVPIAFKDAKGLTIDGKRVVELMRTGRILEAISRKPVCGTPEEATVLPTMRIKISDVLPDFDLKPRPHDPLADFDIKVRKRG